MDRIIYQKVILDCNSDQAFQFFTLNANLKKWFAADADVVPETGGRYELYWRPEDKENDSTFGCKILAIESGKLLNFEWKGPVQFRNFMNTRRPLTNVNVSFHPSGNQTEIHVVHTGWGEDDEWEQARQWFIKAWEGVLNQLKSVVNDNSIPNGPAI